MKKVLTVFVVLSVFFATFSVSAMSEKNLLKKFTTSYEINGNTFRLSDGDQVLAKRYLDQYEVSSKDADYIAQKVDEAVSLMRKSGVKDFSDFGKLPASLKKDLKQLVLDVAANTSVKATVTKGSVVIYNSDDTVFAEITKLVKDTGSNLNIIASVALLVTAVGAVLIVRNVKANA